MLFLGGNGWLTCWRHELRIMRFSSRLLGCRRGAAALEFAIVSLPFFGLLIGAMTVAVYFYLQFALDYSLQEAVRQVQIGKIAGSMTAANFAGTVFCPILAAFVPCTNVLVSVQPVADYYNASFVSAAAQQSAFCVGTPGQLMYARAVYQAPVLSMIYPLIAAVAGPGSNGTSIISAAAFANENPSGAAVASVNGC